MRAHFLTAIAGAAILLPLSRGQVSANSFVDWVPHGINLLRDK